MKKTTEMPCQIGKKTNIFIWTVIILSCVYIVIDPIDRYFHADILGLFSYKSYLYSARDLLFALCAIIGLLNFTKYPLLGWTFANISVVGFIISPIYSLCVGNIFRTNILDLMYIMPVVSFILLFMMNKKNCRPKYWYVYLPIIFVLTFALTVFIVYAGRNCLWINNEIQ